MAPSVYLQTSDYATYGLPAVLAPNLVLRASVLIDTYCKRAMAVTSYTEQLRLPSGRNRVLLSYTPAVALAPATIPYVTAQGRYGYPRRASSSMQVFPATSLLELSSIFGGPPQWEDIDVTQIVDNHATGEIWLPPGIYMAQYTEIKITYTAGYVVVPDAIMAACAYLVFAYLERAAMMGMKGKVTALVASDHTLIDADIKAMLDPYRVRVMR
jgi:hypothetical protein